MQPKIWRARNSRSHLKTKLIFRAGPKFLLSNERVCIVLHILYGGNVAHNTRSHDRERTHTHTHGQTQHLQLCVHSNVPRKVCNTQIMQRKAQKTKLSLALADSTGEMKINTKTKIWLTMHIRDAATHHTIIPITHLPPPSPFTLPG